MQREYGSMRRPYEPPAASTYRRRRLGVLVALVATVGVTALVFAVRSSPGDGGGSAGGQPAAAAQPSPYRTGESPAPGPTVTVTVTATPEPAAGAALPGHSAQPCREVRVRLRTGTNRNAYGGGDEPKVTVRVEPTKRCVLDPDRIGLTVTSGSDHIWSAQDCPSGDRPVWTAGPRHPYTMTVTWQRARSNPATCGKKRSAAGSGWYEAEATLGDERSNEAVFRLK